MAIAHQKLAFLVPSEYRLRDDDLDCCAYDQNHFNFQGVRHQHQIQLRGDDKNLQETSQQILAFAAQRAEKSSVLALLKYRQSLH